MKRWPCIPLVLFVLSGCSLGTTPVRDELQEIAALTRSNWEAIAKVQSRLSAMEATEAASIRGQQVVARELRKVADILDPIDSRLAGGAYPVPPDDHEEFP